MLFEIFVIADVTGLHGKDGVIATHASVFARVPYGSTLAVNNHSNAHLLACVRVRIELKRRLRLRKVPVVFLAPSRFPGPSLAPLAALEALWVAWRTVVRTEDLGYAIRGRIVAKGDSDLPHTAEVSWSVEAIRGSNIVLCYSTRVG